MIAGFNRGEQFRFNKELRIQVTTTEQNKNINDGQWTERNRA